MTGRGGVSGDPGPPRAPDARRPAPAQTPGQGIRVRARARPGRIRRDQSSPAGPGGRILRRDPKRLLLPVTLPGAAAGDAAAAAAAWSPRVCARVGARVCLGELGGAAHLLLPAPPTPPPERAAAEPPPGSPGPALPPAPAPPPASQSPRLRGARSSPPRRAGVSAGSSVKRRAAWALSARLPAGLGASRAPGPSAPRWPACSDPESPSLFSPPGSRARAVASQTQPAPATEHAQCGAPGLGWGWAGAGLAAGLPRARGAGRGRRAGPGSSLEARARLVGPVTGRVGRWRVGRRGKPPSCPLLWALPGRHPRPPAPRTQLRSTGPCLESSTYRVSRGAEPCGEWHPLLGRPRAPSGPWGGGGSKAWRGCQEWRN